MHTSRHKCCVGVLVFQNSDQYSAVVSRKFKDYPNFQFSHVNPEMHFIHTNECRCILCPEYTFTAHLSFVHIISNQTVEK
jgi:hypothetical protein